jgi:hypothetical protein
MRVSSSPSHHERHWLGVLYVRPIWPSRTDGQCDERYDLGTPPVDLFNQQFDAGDLSKHSVFPTYFSEFSFQFTSVQRATEYNTADDPGGPTVNAACLVLRRLHWEQHPTRERLQPAFQSV